SRHLAENIKYDVCCGHSAFIRTNDCQSRINEYPVETSTDRRHHRHSTRQITACGYARMQSITAIKFSAHLSRGKHGTTECLTGKTGLIPPTAIKSIIRFYHGITGAHHHANISVISHHFNYWALFTGVSNGFTFMTMPLS